MEHNPPTKASVFWSSVGVTVIVWCIAKLFDLAVKHWPDPIYNKG